MEVSRPKIVVAVDDDVDDDEFFLDIFSNYALSFQVLKKQQHMEKDMLFLKNYVEATRQSDNHN